MLLPSPSFCFSNCSALPARPSFAVFSLWGDVFWRVLMTVRAVRFGLLPFSACFSTKRKTSSGGKFFQRQNFFSRPSKQKPLAKGLMRYSQFFRPFDQSFSLPIMLNINAPSAVSLLLFSRSPFAIFGRISKAVVNAFYSQAFRSLSHIRQKVFKLFPSFAIVNSAPPIIGEEFVVRVPTSLLERAPNSIGRRTRESMFFSMRKFFGGLGRLFFSKATTRFNISMPYVVVSNFFLVSASAFKDRVILFCRFCDKFQHNHSFLDVRKIMA